MHADEAVLADKTGTLLETGRWKYDPHDYHGPVLAYAAAGAARATGIANYAALSETVLRFVPAAFGILLVVLALDSGLLPALFVALSPVLVFYSRFFIPEMLLGAFSMGLLLCALRCLDRSNLVWAMAAGICAGLMLATKETAVLAFGALTAAWFIDKRKLPRPAHLSAMAGICAATLLLSSGVLSNARAVLQSLQRVPGEYVHRAFSDARHAHPWFYYLLALRAELISLPLALIGALASWKSRKLLSVYAALMMFIYFALPYKTPWCSVQFWFPLLLLAGQGAEWLAAKHRSAGVVVFFVCAYSGWMCWKTSFLKPASPENPYVYAQTLPDALAAPEGLEVRVQIFSRENLWPLPWYFRRLVHQEWWNGVPAQGDPAPIILVTPDMEPKLAEWLYERRPAGMRELYVNLFPRAKFLRPGVEVRGYIAKSLWDGIRERSSIPTK
jgi:uncharacterized protein (TIGR03663 family)